MTNNANFTIPGYQIGSEKMRGKNTILYEAVRESDNKSVLIKTLKNKRPTIDEIAAFKHEYKIMRLLRSSSVVRAYAIEQHQQCYYIIQENVDAPSLADILEKQGRLSVSVFIPLAIKMVQILDEIHKQNVIHKDIKPANILCDLNTQLIKITDFGLSIYSPREKIHNISLGCLEGTLSYIAPEQTGRMNRGVDYRSDYYALGVTFYQLLTGQLPFTSTDVTELLHSHMAVIPKAPYEINNAISPALSAIVLKLLAKNAEERYQSAYGLIKDLEICQQHIKVNERDFNFTVGEFDQFNHFQIPEKLYGRETELKQLLSSYKKACLGDIQLVFVAGYSGSGKSSLVQELYKPVIAENGYFTTGKFEQYQRNIPYAAFVSALDKLLRDILSKNKATIANIRDKILASLETNAQVVIQVLPILVEILGPQPTVVTLGFAESQNRFRYLFRNFILALALDEPVVIFIDDLQWADTSSLMVIKELVSYQGASKLMIIGSYRDNEVDEKHALNFMLTELKNTNVSWKTINLPPLSPSCVEELIADTLHTHKENIQDLSQICYRKTAGNPFFLIQLISSLYDDRIIEFNMKENMWQYSKEAILKRAMTDNVISLMVDKLHKLSADAQKLLRLAACIGNTFTVELLAQISTMPVEDVNSILDEPLQEIYIMLQDHNTFNFTHDRIQQAAYTLLDENEKILIHLNLARTINKTNVQDIFSIVNHYNIALTADTSFLIDQNEIRKIALLNLEASQLAKKSAATDSAMQYIQRTISFLNDDIWAKDYSLALLTYSEACEIAYLSADYCLVNFYTSMIMKNAKNIYDELRAIEVKILSYLGQIRYEKSINLACTTIKHLGYNYSYKPSMIHILYKLLRIKLAVPKHSISKLIDLPDMQRPDIRAITDLSSLIMSAVYRTNPRLMLYLAANNALFSIKYGNGPASAYAYACIGTICIGVLGDIEKGYQFGLLSMKLIDKNQNDKYKAKVNFTWIVFISHWKDYFPDNVAKLLNNAELSFDMGDVEFGCLNLFSYIPSAYFTGFPLKALLAKAKSIKERITDVKYTHDSLCVYYQAIQNMVEECDRPGSLVGTIYNESEMIPKLELFHDRATLYSIYLNKMILQYHFHQFEDAFVSIEKCEKNLSGAVSSFSTTIFYLYKCLISLALYPKKSNWQKAYLLRNVKDELVKIEDWSRHAPSNHLPKYFLINAELAKINEQNDKAGKLYDQAIAAARQYNYLHEEALANELAAQFYILDGRNKLATIYMTEARYCYEQWGAEAKVKFLDKHYTDFIDQTRNISLSVLDSTTTSGRLIGDILDVNALQKTLRAMSGIIVLPNLLKRLMHIMIENAGAQHGYLLLNEDDNYFIEAEGLADKEDVAVLQAVPISQDNLPMSIINYVINSKQAIIFDSSSPNAKSYLQDTYMINVKPLSIICLPILNRNRILGILYLENNLIPGAFTQKHIDTLEILSLQAAISLENAQLFYKATHDSLTGLANRNLLYQVFASNAERVVRNGKILAILFADLDKFKMINDTLGHEVGDKVLLHFSEKLKSCIREGDLVVRLGGDEFVVMLEDVAIVNIENIVQRFLTELAQPVNIQGHQLIIRASIGISVFPHDAIDIADLLRMADEALYRVKDTGRGHYQFYVEKQLERV